MKLNTSGDTCLIWERMTSELEMIPIRWFFSSTTGSFWMPLRNMTRAASLMSISGSATMRLADMT